MRYIYSDECIFSDPKPCIGTGMLISDYEITQKLIGSAMNNLINDPDRFIEPEKSMDDSTIANGYFHASEDSKNGHSHLCQEINKTDHAEFTCAFFDQQLMASDEQSVNYLFRHSAMLSSLVGTNTRKEVVFSFEERQGVSIDSLSRMFSELEENHLIGIYDLAFIPHFFPKVNFLIVDKSNPGVQCTDFILWAVNRKENGDKTWFDRIKSSFKTEFNTESGSWGGKDIYLGKGLINPVNYYDVKDFPKNSDSIITNENLAKSYFHAVKVIDYYAENIPESIMHLKEDLQELASIKLNTDSEDYFTKLSSCYLKLFDMAPIIGESTPHHEKEFLLVSKKCMSLLLRKDLTSGVLNRIQLEKYKKEKGSNLPLTACF